VATFGVGLIDIYLQLPRSPPTFDALIGGIRGVRKKNGFVRRRRADLLLEKIGAGALARGELAYGGDQQQAEK